MNTHDLLNQSDFSLARLRSTRSRSNSIKRNVRPDFSNATPLPNTPAFATPTLGYSSPNSPFPLQKTPDLSYPAQLSRSMTMPNKQNPPRSQLQQPHYYGRGAQNQSSHVPVPSTLSQSSHSSHHTARPHVSPRSSPRKEGSPTLTRAKTTSYSLRKDIAHRCLPQKAEDAPLSMEDGSINPFSEELEKIEKKDSTFESLLSSIVANKQLNRMRFEQNSQYRRDIHKANSWVEYTGIDLEDYGRFPVRQLQKQEMLFQLAKYQQLNLKNDKKAIWDTIGYDFLFLQDELIVFPETKAVVYDDFFGYFNTLQQLEDLCEKHLHVPILEELEKGSSGKLCNVGNVCVIFNDWLFKIVDSYQMYINQLIVTKFWLEMELFKDRESNAFLNWLSNNFENKFPYEELILNYLIDNLNVYVSFFEKLLKLHIHKKASTSYKKIQLVLASLRMFVAQCHAHYSSMEFKNFLLRFNWNCAVTGNVEYKWRNLKMINRNKINNQPGKIDYLILFNNCLVLCKLDIYLKEFIIDEYPVPIEFLETADAGPNKLKVLHRGKRGLLYALTFFDHRLKEQWAAMISETRSQYLSERTKIDPFEMVPILANVVDVMHMPITRRRAQVENAPILAALEKSSGNVRLTNAVGGRILCALTMVSNGQTYHVIGTNSGLYIDDINRTGVNWKKLSGIRNVRQVESIKNNTELIVTAGDLIVRFDFNNILKSILDPNYHLVGHDICTQKALFFKVGKVNGVLHIVYRYIPASVKKSTDVSQTGLHFRVLRMTNGDFETFHLFDLPDQCFDVLFEGRELFLLTTRGFFRTPIPEGYGVTDPPISPLQIVPGYLYDSDNTYTLDDRMFLQSLGESLSAAKPVKALKGLSGELLLAFDTMAVAVSKSTGLILRFDVVHFNLSAEDVAFKDDTLFAVLNDCIEIFRPKKGSGHFLSHVQVILAEHIALVDLSLSVAVVLDHPLEGPAHQLVMQLVDKNADSELHLNLDLALESDSDSETDHEEEAEDLDYKRKSRASIRTRHRKLTLDKMRIMDLSTRLPAQWGALWDVSTLPSGFTERQEKIFLLLKMEEELRTTATVLHRGLGFDFLSDAVGRGMVYPASKDEIYRHTFGCLTPVRALHDKLLWRPMLEILNQRSKALPLYDFLELYEHWVDEASFVYLDYASRLAHLEWFFELESRSESLSFLQWLRRDPNQVRETLEIFIRHLSALEVHFGSLAQTIRAARAIDANVEISKIEQLVGGIKQLREQVNSKLKLEKFGVIVSSMEWEIQDDLTKKSFLSTCVKQLIWFDEIHIKVNDGLNKIYKKRRLIMLFPNWLLIAKYHKDRKVFQVSERPLMRSQIKFEYLNSDHSAINVYGSDGRIMYKFNFPSRGDKTRWFELLTGPK